MGGGEFKGNRGGLTSRATLLRICCKRQTHVQKRGPIERHRFLKVVQKRAKKGLLRGSFLEGVRLVFGGLCRSVGRLFRNSNNKK